MSLATASSNVYTVTFDGTTVSILAAKRQKVLRQFPVSQLQAVEYKPASGPAGGRIRFRVAGSSSSRDTIVFTRGQEPEMARLAGLVQRYVMPAATVPVQRRQAYADPRVTNAAVRALTWATRLELLTVLLILIPCLIGIGVAIWLWVVV